MKTSDILSEAPYLHDGKYTQPDMDKDTYHSNDTLTRNYRHLCTTSSAGVDINFYLQDNIRCVATIKKKKEKTREESNLIVFSLLFKNVKTIINYPEGIKESEVLQVDSVYVRPEFREFGLASFAYMKLVEAGFIVVSDSSQFEDGKRLWKKLSREAHFNNYVIHLIDDEEGFLKDKNGEVITYDSSNIDDAKIWTAGIDLNGAHILLMMKSK